MTEAYRCGTCGLTEISPYYYRTAALCNTCFAKLPPDQRAEIERAQPIKLADHESEENGVAKQAKQKFADFWYRPIRTPDQAAGVLKEAGKGFLWLAALQLLLSFWVGAAIVADALVNATLALLLIKLKSRVVAILLLCFAVLTLLVTSVNRFAARPAGPSNVILAVIMVWFAARAVMAAFFYQGARRRSADQPVLPA